MEYALMMRCGWERAMNFEEADAVFFVGGSDVNPALYGEEALKGTGFHIPTDNRDLTGWRMSAGKMRIGICRGGQFLNVMNGGKLWQDVDGHCGSHDLVDKFTGQVVRVSSTHHQQFRPAMNGITIATARETTKKVTANQTWSLKNDHTPMDDYFKIDHEVVWYPSTRSLCFQPHPEYLSPEGTEPYFRSVLNKCWDDEYKQPLKMKG